MLSELIRCTASGAWCLVPGLRGTRRLVRGSPCHPPRERGACSVGFVTSARHRCTPFRARYSQAPTPPTACAHAPFFGVFDFFRETCGSVRHGRSRGADLTDDLIRTVDSSRPRLHRRCLLVSARRQILIGACARHARCATQALCTCARASDPESFYLDAAARRSGRVSLSGASRYAALSR